MPTYDDLVAHFKEEAAEAARILQDPQLEKQHRPVWIRKEWSAKDAADYLLAQRAGFLGEIDRIENGLREELAKVTQERDARDPGRVRPSDYNEMEVSSTKGWPRAIKKVMKNEVYLTIKAEHDQIMDNWVGQRGDGLSPNDYDYLVYSHAIVWEKALKEMKVPVENCQDIRKKYMEFMTFLFDD